MKYKKQKSAKTKGKARNRKYSKLNAFFYYINPKTISAEAKRYGYPYKISNTIILYLTMAAALSFIGYMYELHTLYIIITVIMGLLAVPFIVTGSYRKMYQQKRFDDAATYMEQMIRSFQKTPKIFSALKDTEIIFPDGPMKETIKKAIYHIEHDYDSQENSSKKALHLIEEEYENEKIRNIHRYLIDIERTGADYQKQLDILLNDKNNWITSVSKMQKEFNRAKRNVDISIIGVLICCLVPTKLLSNTVSISNIYAYQVCTVIALAVALILYIKTDSKTTVNWLKQKKTYSDEEITEKYTKVVTYDKNKQKIKSLIYAIIPIIATVYFSSIHNAIGISVGVIVSIFLLNQHSIDYNMKKKIVSREIEKELPLWLLNLSLLIQQDNIENSIAKSLPDAPAVLKPAIRKLNSELAETSEDITPYLNFLLDFNIPVVQATMKMLYAISSGSTVNPEEQITELINRNTQLIAKADSLAQEDIETKLKLMIFAPNIIGIFKIGVDLILVLLSFMQYSPI